MLILCIPKPDVARGHLGPSRNPIRRPFQGLYLGIERPWDLETPPVLDRDHTPPVTTPVTTPITTSPGYHSYLATLPYTTSPG